VLGSILSAVAELRDLRPDVVLMDMPNVDGIEALRRILALGVKAPPVVMLTTYDLDEYLYDALAARASGT
jgi:DNA-binding NarL/FixJ family response regulator